MGPSRGRVTVLTGAYLLQRGTGEKRPAAILAGVGTPLTAVVGLSRVRLREHHPSDIVGSFVLGAIWLALLRRWISERLPADDRSQNERSLD